MNYRISSRNHPYYLCLLTKTMKNSLNPKISITAKGGVTALLYTALLSLSPAAVTSLTGDHKIAADSAASPPEAGDLTVAGDFAAGGGVDFGALPTPGLYGVWMTYDKASRTVLFDLTENNGSIQWRQNTQSGTAFSKMTLTATNSLSLFKTDGSVAGIVFDPNAGAITLAGANNGIFFGTNTTATLKAAPNGSAIFPNSVTLDSISGILKINGTAAATSSITGALTVAGGLGVGMDAYINGVRVGRGVRKWGHEHGRWNRLALLKYHGLLEHSTGQEYSHFQHHRHLQYSNRCECSYREYHWGV